MNPSSATFEPSVTYAATASARDMIFVESPGPQHLPLIAKRLKAPLLYNMATSGKTPFLAKDEIERLGVPVPCRTYDPEVFFAESPADVEYAKSLCQTCPVREACLAGAKDRREPWGVWGGELFIQGVVVARKRPRGRPRKNAVAA